MLFLSLKNLKVPRGTKGSDSRASRRRRTHHTREAHFYKKMLEIYLKDNFLQNKSNGSMNTDI